MATIDLIVTKKPCLYHAQTVGLSRHVDLAIEKGYLRAGDALNLRMSGNPPATINKNPPNKHDIARVIATHYGYVPDRPEFEVLIFGAEESAAAMGMRRKKFLELRRTIFNELWGSKMQKMIRGIIFSDDVQTCLTLWEMHAQMYEIPPEDTVETEEQAQSRWATVDAYRAAWKDVQKRYRELYEKKADSTRTKMENAFSRRLIKLERKMFLYRRILSNIPRPVVPKGPFLSREQIKSVMPRMLVLRPEADRLDFWRSHWSRDMLAAQLDKFRSIVDIRGLSLDGMEPDYYAMLGARFAAGADYLHRLSIIPRDQIARIQSETTAGGSRVSKAVKDLDRTLEAYERIRNLHEQLGFDSSLFGSWLDVPVRKVKAPKRKAASNVPTDIEASSTKLAKR